MATVTQYGVFKALYDEESDRYSGLERRSNLYLTIITFYLGVILFKVEDLLKVVSQFRIPLGLFLAVGVALVGALFLTVLAMGIHEYEGICDPERVIKDFGKSHPDDDQFLDDRIVDLAVATNRNASRTIKWQLGSSGPLG